MTPEPSVNHGHLRSRTLDALRGFGILVVVLAHVIWGLREANFPLSRTLLCLYDWIFLYAAQLLFFVSGCLAPKARNVPRQKAFRSKAGAILYPYLLWSIILWTARALTPGANAQSHPEQLFALLIVPYDIYWFLYELFLFFSVYIFFSQLNKCLFLFISILLYTIHSVFVMPPAISLFCTHFIYFILGTVLSDKLKEYQIKKNEMFFLSTSFLFIHAYSSYEAIINYKMRYYHDVLMMTPVISAIFGAFLSLKMCEKTAATKVLAFIGRYSMHIYVAHILFTAGTRIGISAFFGPQHVALHLVAGTLAGLLGPLALALIAAKMRCDFIYRWPKKAAGQR